MIRVPQEWLTAFWAAFAASAVAAWPVYRVLLALRSRQTVSEYAPEGHQAKQGTPTMGGIIVLIGIAAGFWYGGVRDPALWMATFGFAAIGFVDDFVVPRTRPGKRGLGWKPKIMMQAAVAAGALALWPFELGPQGLAVCFTLILFFANAYNFADGLDGLAGTIGALLATGFAGLAAINLTPSAGTATIALIAAMLPFLMLNAPPARLFMGDVGALGIGAMFGVLAPQLVQVMFERPAVIVNARAMVFALAVLSVLLVAELVPVPLQIAWVKVFKRRLFPYTPIHHAFEKAGWPETRVVAMFCLAQALLLAAALTMAARSANVPPSLMGGPGH